MRISLSARGWTALILAFALIVGLLGLLAVTLISQRQRTVLLNRQLGSLLGEATLVLQRAGPILDAVPARSSTIATRARSAADLVAEARPLISALNASGLPGTVSAAGQVLQSIDQPGALVHTLGNLDRLATDANHAALVPGLAQLLGEVPAASKLMSQASLLADAAQRTRLISRVLDGLNDLATLVRLQTHTLAVQEASLRNGDRTRELTAEALATARRTLATAQQILIVAEQTLMHAANIDRKTGPAPPSTTALP